MAQGAQIPDHIVYLALNDEHLAEEIVCQMSCFGLQGHIITTANTFAETLLIRRPSAVIMDIGFARGDLYGAKIMAEVQSQLDNPIPVIFISGRDDLEARLASVRAKGSTFLAQPLDVSQVVAKLESLAEREAQPPYRVLVVEDSRAQAHFIASTLSQADMEIEVVHEPFELSRTLVEFRPELILMDIYLPKCNGLELARVIRQQETYDSVPIVFLSSEQDLSRQLKAMMLGGDDFLTKPITPEHLISAIQSRAARSRLLRGYMIRDSLTGLLNHTHTLEQLDIEIARAQRLHKPLCFVMLDIDHFKKVNDTYGHPVGDRVIKSLSHLLQQRLRKTDTVGRYGGEEFAIILANTTARQAQPLIEEIRRAFATLRHFAAAGPFQITLSAGIAELQVAQSAKALTEEADRALYQAKRLGRNRSEMAYYAPKSAVVVEEA